MARFIHFRPAALFSGLALILSIIGIIAIYSASSVFALERYGSSEYFALRQGCMLLVGIICAVIIQKIPLQVIRYLSPISYLIAVLLTLSTITRWGVIVHGSRRWLSIFGISFQPSELLKITSVLYAAHILARLQDAPRRPLYPLITIGAILICSCGILLLQPDFGMAVCIFLTILIQLFVAYLHIGHILGLTVIMAPIISFLVIATPYRLKRILIFLDPWSDPQGAGFQVIQSLIAIGSGGLTGIGISQSRQKFFYLPMQHTDFIFSIIAEETGFIGSLFLISLFILLTTIGISTLSRLENSFARSIVLGGTMLITIQACINIGVSCGLLPTKGIGLPFVSYGNSSLISFWILVGIISSALHTTKKYFNN